MEIWLDSINHHLIEEAAKAGIITGITTNPSILSKTKDVRGTLLKLLDIQQGSIAVQVIAPTAQGMIEEAQTIYDFSKQMIIKVPVNKEGLIALSHLIQEKIPVMATGIFHPTQVILATNLGVDYLAPYLSHMGENIECLTQLQRMKTIIKNNTSSTKILVASIKDVQHIVECAEIGCDAITLKDDLFIKLLETQPQLQKVMEKFNEEWSNAFKHQTMKELLA